MYSIRETFVFYTEIYTFRIFIRSFFSFLRCDNQLVVLLLLLLFFVCFFPTRYGARGHAVVMVNDPFFGPSFFFGSEELRMI